jgi:hypothetical protein
VIAERSRREKVFIVLAAIALLYAFAILLFGLNMFFADNKTHFRFDFQWLSIELLSDVFFPLLIFGLRKPSLASLLLFGCGGASVALLLTISNRSGDGTAEAIVGNAVLIGVPAFLTGFLFRWRTW